MEQNEKEKQIEVPADAPGAEQTAPAAEPTPEAPVKAKKSSQISTWTALLLVVLAAILASLCTRLWLMGEQRNAPSAAAPGSGKLDQAMAVIDRYFVGDYDTAELEDAGVDALVTALGDRWSYYLPADEVEAYRQTMSNRFAGIGVVIEYNGEQTEIVSVYPHSPSAAAGVEPGSIIRLVNGESVEGLDLTGVKDLIGKYIDEGLVRLTVLAGEKERTFEIVPATFEIDPVSYELLDRGVGLVRIDNFDSKAAAQFINACKELQKQGATALVFDLRFNPGGQLEELLNALDYLLPEGVIFQSEEKGQPLVTDSSDAACLRLPMAVLVNSESYSAAEFFAAALQEYEWATVVGEHTTGKGYAQITVSLSDGSAMHISARKYYTPKGVSLAGVGIAPDIEVGLDEADFRMLYYDRLAPEDDEQLQAAVEAVLGD